MSACPVCLERLPQGRRFCERHRYAYLRQRTQAYHDGVSASDAEKVSALKLSLSDGANPTPCGNYPVDKRAYQRGWDCSSYMGCLTAVADANWHSFTCVKCPRYVAPKERAA